MLSQIRIYTINKGQMGAFLKHFKEEVMDPRLIATRDGYAAGETR